MGCGTLLAAVGGIEQAMEPLQERSGETTGRCGRVRAVYGDDTAEVG
jgi:hypothetical protein